MRPVNLANESKGLGSPGVHLIPIDILRTITYVSKFRSQTLAAAALGISQPTVSTHLKRAQEILGVEIFDKSVPGVTPTQTGEAIIKHAWAILDLNDEVFRMCSRSRSQQLIRIGMHSSFVEAILPAVLNQCRHDWPGLRFQVTSDASEYLLAALQEGELDIALALTVSEPAFACKHHWVMELVWACAPQFAVDAADPVPLVSYEGNSQLTQVAKTALAQAGLDFETIYSCSGAASLSRAVASGLGVSVMARESLTPDIVVF